MGGSGAAQRRLRQVRKILGPVFVRRPRVRRLRRRAATALDFAPAQVDAPDLAGDRLGQLGELEPAHALERRDVFADMAIDRSGGFG